MEERFNLVDEFPDYEVGDKGTVISHRRPRTITLKGKYDKDGYIEYQLRDKHGNRKYRRGHRLVALAFMGAPPTDSHVLNHKNGVKDDNRLENLEWCTISENTLHGWHVLNRVPSRHSSIKTVVYDVYDNVVGVFSSGVEAAKFLNVTSSAVQKNKASNDNGKRHSRGRYLINKKYYCRTYSNESVETIEKDAESA